MSSDEEHDGHNYGVWPRAIPSEPKEKPAPKPKEAKGKKNKKKETKNGK